MPVKVKYANGKYRVVEAASGRITKTATGKARDGGGHKTSAKAAAQARAINANVKRRK